MGRLARPGFCFGLWQQQDFFCEAEEKFIEYWPNFPPFRLESRQFTLL
jgi:hypothetical protein